MSSSDAPRLSAYLGYILQAISRILEYLKGMDEVTFIQDHRTQDAVSTTNLRLRVTLRDIPQLKTSI